MDCESYDTEGIVMLVCVGVLVCIDGVVVFTSCFFFGNICDRLSQIGVVLMLADLTAEFRVTL